MVRRTSADPDTDPAVFVAARRQFGMKNSHPSHAIQRVYFRVQKTMQNARANCMAAHFRKTFSLSGIKALAGR